MDRAEAYRVCFFCNKAAKFVLRSDAKSFGISARFVSNSTDTAEQSTRRGSLHWLRPLQLEPWHLINLQAQSAQTSKATLALAANAPAAPARFSIGQKVVVVTMANSVSCKSFDYAKRLSELIRSDDMIAVSHFIAIMEPTGECRYLPKGTVAIVEHSDWYGYYCIRPEADIDCLWADMADARRCCNSGGRR
jgi:hypothetical protein